MLVQSVMKKEVVTISPEATAAEAAALLEEKGLRSLVVTENREVKGIITDSDFIFRVVSKGRDPNQTKVKEIMTANPKTVSPDLDVFEAVKIMEDLKIRRLPVVKDNKLVGILSVGDLASHLLVRMEFLRSS